MKHNIKRVIFVLPGRSTVTSSKSYDAYLYSVVEFCKNFTDAVYAWAESRRNDPVIQTNMKSLMQYRGDGLAPYVQGRVIA
jgi:hypothetical protein